MASRRLSISSLLCSDDDPATAIPSTSTANTTTPPSSVRSTTFSPVPEPVILAPHLCNPRPANNPPFSTESLSTSTEHRPDKLTRHRHSRSTEYTLPSSLTSSFTHNRPPSQSSHRPPPFPPPFVYDNLSSQHLLRRPSPPFPLSQNNPQFPLLRQPTSPASHPQQHLSSFHRSSVSTPSADISVPPTTANPPHERRTFAGLQALVHAASEERRKLGSGGAGAGPASSTFPFPGTPPTELEYSSTPPTSPPRPKPTALASPQPRQHRHLHDLADEDKHRNSLSTPDMSLSGVGFGTGVGGTFAGGDRDRYAPVKFLGEPTYARANSATEDTAATRPPVPVPPRQRQFVQEKPPSSSRLRSLLQQDDPVPPQDTGSPHLKHRFSADPPLEIVMNSPGRPRSASPQLDLKHSAAGAVMAPPHQIPFTEVTFMPPESPQHSDGRHQKKRRGSSPSHRPDMMVLDDADPSPPPPTDGHSYIADVKPQLKAKRKTAKPEKYRSERQKRRQEVKTQILIEEDVARKLKQEQEQVRTEDNPPPLPREDPREWHFEHYGGSPVSDSATPYPSTVRSEMESEQAEEEESVKMALRANEAVSSDASAAGNCDMEVDVELTVNTPVAPLQVQSPIDDHHPMQGGKGRLSVPPVPTPSSSSVLSPTDAMMVLPSAATLISDHSESMAGNNNNNATATATASATATSPPKFKEPVSGEVKPKKAKVTKRAKPKPKQTKGAAVHGPTSTSAGTKELLAAHGVLPPSTIVTPASRSRSASVMPRHEGDVKLSSAVEEAVKVEGDGGEEWKIEEEDDDKLYCVCETKYDEDRVMIACDRCDEWYHTQCVDMPDLEVDLVDQFICPPCISKNPEISLTTTYKRRCLTGLNHADPSCAEACHNPARGVFSKYCSDECGIRYMHARIETWVQGGGERERLWKSVRGVEKREGFVVVTGDAKSTTATAATAAAATNNPSAESKTERAIRRLNPQLERVVRWRERVKREMDVVLWRKRLLELAAERAESGEACGWDQRLCFGDEEWADFGVEVLESYEEEEEGGGEGEWWCGAKKKCERHFGWQALRSKDVALEIQKKEALLLKLTSQEREIRKRIEDFVDQDRVVNDNGSFRTADEFSFPHHRKANGEVAGKKRKGL